MTTNAFAGPSTSQTSQYNAGEIMAGFHGEYWQLNGDLNPFDESMHAIARVHTLLGGDGVTIQVAKKIDID